MNYENTYQPIENRLDFSDIQEKMNDIKTELKKVIVGQDDVIDQLILALLSDGQSLIEALPSVAKTMKAK